MTGSEEATGAGGNRYLRFEQVSVVAPDGPAMLEAVTMDLPMSGVTVVVGPSGSGKTTLLRCCNRLIAPDAGRVLLDGEDVATMVPRTLRRRVGMVFQRPTMFAGTVRDNLAVADARDDRPAGVERDGPFGASLAACGLGSEFLDRTGDDLSGGEAQRACIARALLTGPEVLLMDEPTSALDPANRAVVEALVGSLVDRGLAVVWVTHDLAQARRLSSDIRVLIGGRVAEGDEARRFLDADDPTGGR